MKGSTHFATVIFNATPCCSSNTVKVDQTRVDLTPLPAVESVRYPATAINAAVILPQRQYYCYKS